MMVCAPHLGQVLRITVLSRLRKLWLVQRESKAPTIVDVANLAGVSRATASRALAGYGRISSETVARVQAAATKIGYRPNEVARAMRAGKTKTIGLVVISDFTNAFFDRATKSIIDAAKNSGYQTVVSHTDENISNERQAIQTLMEKRVDGLILVPSSDTDHQHLNSASLGKTPLVLIDRKLTGTKFSSVTTGDYDGAVQAVTYAYEKGHQQMAFIIAVPGIRNSTSTKPVIPISTVEDRTNGFEAAIKDLNISSKMLFCEDSQEGAEAAVENLLADHKRPSILFTSNNDMLLAVLRVAGKLKIAIGKDLSVISYDDSPWAAAMSPAITVIARPVDELGTIAVELLLEQMSGENVRKDVVLPTTLIERESVANLKR
jgi:LacI family transcriptional regulator